jgi:periplasmic divalent cation tolerance protein
VLRNGGLKILKTYNMSFALLYVTFEKEEEATEIVDNLLERKLIAGANVVSSQSSFWWKGAVQKRGEYLAVMQTSIHIWEKVERAIEEMHPYEVPCIIRLEAESNVAYEKWIEDIVCS